MTIVVDPDVPGSFLGRGLAWPLRENPDTGDFQKSDAEQSVSDCIRHTISTTQGEIALLEEFGTLATRLLFENDLDNVVQIVGQSITEALDRHEKRIIVLGIDFEIKANTRSTIRTNVKVRYRIRATGAVDTGVYPFTINSPGEIT